MNTIIDYNDRWELTGLSERGPRSENQDNYLIINSDGECHYLKDEKEQQQRIDDWPEEHIRLAVADGMGGHKNGRQVSESLIQALIALPFQDNPVLLKEALFDIHEQLFQHYHQGPRTPGTTLVIADINPEGKVLIATIGDSRTLLWDKQQWQTLTYDHTSVEFAWRDNEIDDEAYDKLTRGATSRIAQAMGFGSVGIVPDQQGHKFRQHIADLRLDIPNTLNNISDDQNTTQQPHYDILERQLNSDEVLVLASDGLWSGQSLSHYEPEEYDHTYSLKTYTKKQIKRALEFGTDNITVAAIHYFAADD